MIKIEITKADAKRVNKMLLKLSNELPRNNQEEYRKNYNALSEVCNQIYQQTELKGKTK